MSPDDLMSVRPEVLAKLILHKRERLVEKLPKLIAELGEQKQISENLARRSRANKEDLDVKVLNLKMERKTVLQELTKMFDKKHDKELTTNHQHILEKIGHFNSIEPSNDEFRELLKICEEADFDDFENPSITSQISASVKANEALELLSFEHEKAKNKWNEDEAHRRQIESKFTKISSSIKESSIAVEFWSEKLSMDFEDLLIDANRVKKGGPSSRQINRNLRKESHSRS